MIPSHVTASIDEWMDPAWQMRNSLKSKKDFEKYFSLSSEELQAFDSSDSIFNIRTTPYYASLAVTINQSGLIAEDEPLKLSINNPIRRILMPHRDELKFKNQQMLDPLGEKQNQKTKRLIHRYSDRVLFLITDFCSVYCRYCTRKHFTGNEQAFAKTQEYIESLNYIKNHTGIREVILSGGDPLTLSDSILEKVLSDLRSIEHIEIIRIGSRMPVVCPQRMTESLAKLLRKYKPVYLMTHFNHPDEITELAAERLELMVDHGIPTFNQMVLLNGINNHEVIIQALSRRLLYLRVKPYYMFQCDPSLGTDHLRTSLDDSLEIQKKLWGHLSGLAMPNLSLDIPNGGGKAYYVPNFETTRIENSIHFKGWDGVLGEYVNPSKSEIIKPFLSDNYTQEWKEICNSKNTTDTILAETNNVFSNEI